MKCQKKSKEIHNRTCIDGCIGYQTATPGLSHNDKVKEHPLNGKNRYGQNDDPCQQGQLFFSIEQVDDDKINNGLFQEMRINVMKGVRPVDSPQDTGGRP